MYFRFLIFSSDTSISYSPALFPIVLIWRSNKVASLLVAFIDLSLKKQSKKKKKSVKKIFIVSECFNTYFLTPISKTAYFVSGLSVKHRCSCGKDISKAIPTVICRVPILGNQAIFLQKALH